MRYINITKSCFKYMSNFGFSVYYLLFYSYFFATATFGKNCIIDKSYAMKLLGKQPSTEILNSKVWLNFRSNTFKKFPIRINMKFQIFSLLQRILLEHKIRSYTRGYFLTFIIFVALLFNFIDCFFNKKLAFKVYIGYKQFHAIL